MDQTIEWSNSQTFYIKATSIRGIHKKSKISDCLSLFNNKKYAALIVTLKKYLLDLGSYRVKKVESAIKYLENTREIKM